MKNHGGKGDVNGWVRRFLKQSDVAVDVGANVGTVTSIMLSCVGPEGHVYAFEPTPQINQIAPAANLTTRQVALGECEGVCKIYGNDSTASRWHDTAWAHIEAPMETLDGMLPTERVDLVKIDAQGSESHILDGAKELLRRCPLWILELWPWGLDTAGRTPEDVILQLHDAGLTTFWPDETKLRIQDIGVEQDRNHFANVYARRL